jgi:hypothetical protein
VPGLCEDGRGYASDVGFWHRPDGRNQRRAERVNVAMAEADWAERVDERMGPVGRSLFRYQAAKAAVLMILLTVVLIVALVRWML